MNLITQIFAVVGVLGTVISTVIAVIQYRRVSVWKKRLTWDDSLRTSTKLLRNIEQSGWIPDIVLGLGRSGGIWGGWLAGNLGSLPFSVIDDKYPEVSFPAGAKILRVLREEYPLMSKMLVVEGASSRGETINQFRDEFSVILQGIEIRFAVLYMNPASSAKIDYVGEVGPEPWPLRFPWHSTDRYRPYLRDLFSRE